MADISLVAAYAAERVDAIGVDRAGARAAPAEPRSIERPSDRVDISDRARFLSKLSALPSVRAELVDRIRQQIAAGTYETDDRLDHAIENLAEDLDAQQS